MIESVKQLMEIMDTNPSLTEASYQFEVDERHLNVTEEIFNYIVGFNFISKLGLRILNREITRCLGGKNTFLVYYKIGKQQ